MTRKRNKKKLWERVEIYVALIGAGALIVAAIINIIPDLKTNASVAIDPSKTLTPTFTQASILPATDSPSINTLTFTPPATSTSSFTPAPTITFTTTNTFTPTPVLISDNGVPMILISAGVFNKYDKEKAYIQVSLPSYYIDQHEVTNGQYEKCVSANVCRPPFTDADPQYENVKHFGDNRYADFPVVLVSYNMSKTYCEWRNNDTRMPTGEEWEKAARGFFVEQTYPWGYYPPSCELGVINGANYSGCNTRDAFPVMSFAPNGYGLFDMSGNVAEWVDEANKLIRGGSWNEGESQIKVFSTFEGETFDGYVNVGFRCAKDVN